MNSTPFGTHIKSLRIQQKLTLREVAAAIELDQSILSKVERNKMQAPERVIPALAVCLKASYKELQIHYLSERLYQELHSIDYNLEAVEILQTKLEEDSGKKVYRNSRKTLFAKIKQQLSKYPIEKAWVFGSFARKEDQPDSDIDLLVRFSVDQPIDLFEYIGIQQDLEDLTGRHIDLVEEGQELAKIRPFIHRDKKLIYERQAI